MQEDPSPHPPRPSTRSAAPPDTPFQSGRWSAAESKQRQHNNNNNNNRQLTLRLQRCTLVEEMRSRQLSADDCGLLTALGPEAGAETGGGAAVAEDPPSGATRRARRPSRDGSLSAVV